MGGLGWTPGTTPAGGTLTSGDASTLSNPYTMSKQDLSTPITFNGQKTTIGNVLDQINSLTPTQLDAWQTQLIDSGYLTASEAGQPIRVNEATNALLRHAALLNADPATELTKWAAVQKKNPVGPAGVRIHATLSNPLDVKQLGDAVAQKLVGRDLTPQEAVDITNMIRGQEMTSAQGELSAQQSLVAPAGQASGVVTTQQPTSAEAATTQYLSQNEPGDVQSHSLLNVFEAIKSKVETDAQGSGPRAASGPVKVI